MKHSLKLVALSVIAAGAPLWAQQTNVERFERQLEQIQRDTRLRVDSSVPAGQRALVDYGGYLSFNFLAIDDIEQSTHILRQYDLVGYARFNVDNIHEFFIRARTSYRDFNSGDDFDGDGDELLSPTIEQAYYRFDLARYLQGFQNRDIAPNNLVFTGGRQFIYWANGLVLGETLDGGLFNFTLDNWQVDILAGATANSTVDFDSSRPDFDQETARNFYGAMLSYQTPRHRPFIYFLAQDDKNENEILSQQLVEGGPIIETAFRYDSQYFGAGSNGSIGDRLVYGIEFVYETGEGLSNSFDTETGEQVDQQYEDIEAWALNAKLDYLLADIRRTRISTELIIASGDDDRGSTSSTFNGNQPGTNDEAFNAFGLLNTGLAFAPAVSNVTVVRGGISTFPIPDSGMFRRLQVGVDGLFFFKTKSDGGFDEETEDDSFLGFEPDLYINWQLSSDVTLALRYGVFFPGDAIIEDDHPRHFFFTGITFAF